VVWEGQYMINEHEKLFFMLSKTFYRYFWKNLIILFSTSLMAMIVFIGGILNFIKGTEDIKIVFLCLIIFIVVLTVTILGMKPFFRDMKLVKMEKYDNITGKIVKYRRVVHGGDPDTITYYPTIRDINKEWIEVEVKAEKTELNQIYHCVYLPNTKIAVCEKR